MDLTTSALGIASVKARSSVMTREDIIPCGVAEAAAIYEYLGADVERVAEEGKLAKAGETLLEAVGMRPAFTLPGGSRRYSIAIGSAVATYTKELVERASKANPGVVVAAARKAPPGLRHLYYRCVLCGGASLHRVGISDSVLIFPNHISVAGGLEAVLSRLEKGRKMIGERPAVIEVGSEDEAVLVAKSGVVDEIQVDHLNPPELAQVVKKVKGLNSNIRVAVGGGISLANADDYARAGADVLVTSAPFWVRPADITTRMERI